MITSPLEVLTFFVFCDQGQYTRTTFYVLDGPDVVDTLEAVIEAAPADAPLLSLGTIRLPAVVAKDRSDVMDHRFYEHLRTSSLLRAALADQAPLRNRGIGNYAVPIEWGFSLDGFIEYLDGIGS